jgi:hypothetical protein
MKNENPSAFMADIISLRLGYNMDTIGRNIGA